MIMRGAIGSVVLAAILFILVMTTRTPHQLDAEVLPPPTSPNPQLPQRSVDLTQVTATGRTISVRANGDLQTALNEARGGDVIALEPGAVYRGPFRLPRKSGDGWILITSRVAPEPLGVGQYVTPADAPRMPKLVAASGPVVIAEPSAHHYRLVGLEIMPADGAFLHNLVMLGSMERDVDDLPHHIIIDRCYLHGDREHGTRRGVALNSRDSAIVHSYLSDFKEVGADSQAIAGWNGTGPFAIADNYLEGAGENVLFGGADPAIRDLVPADIEVLRNRVAKPLAWRMEAPEYAGVPWTVKNLFELKNARRVLVDGNVFEYNWPHAQNGFAILFTVRNQDGGSPWSTVEDVTFQNNLVQHVASAINVLGTDDIHTSQPTRRISVRNNLFVDVGGSWSGGRLFQLLDGAVDVRIEHNTALQTETAIYGGDHSPHDRFVFENNVLPLNQYGVIGANTAPGRPSLDRYFPEAVVKRNVFVGGEHSSYPPDNFFPASLDAVGFVNLRRGDYRLARSSGYKHAGTDGRDPGADIDAVAPAIVGKRERP
jgi:hypothetical protein